MHPSSIISYYPTYDLLDEIISSSSKCNGLNIFIDLKNVMQTLYMEHAIINVVENTIKSGFIDTSLFISLISFLSFHKLYSVKRNIDVNFYVFFETGESYYHKNISKKYKISRRIDTLYGLDHEKRELFFSVVQKNLLLVEKCLNLVPNVNVIRLQNMEADFIPYFLITRKLVDSEKYVNIVYSNDHDLLQCIDDNTFVFFKARNKKRIIKKNEVMKFFFKKDDFNFPDSYLSLSMSIIGDSGDDIDGIKKIGPKLLSQILDELVSMVGGIKHLQNNVVDGNKIFTNGSEETTNKYIREIILLENNENIISRNMRLIDFEVISREFENPKTTEILDKRNQLFSLFKNKNVAPLQVLEGALKKSNIYFDLDDLSNLYFGS